MPPRKSRSSDFLSTFNALPADDQHLITAMIYLLTYDPECRNMDRADLVRRITSQQGRRETPQG